MLSLSIYHLLEVFENHLALNKHNNSDVRLYFSDSKFSIGGQNKVDSFRNFQLESRFAKPLTDLEERRLKVLDRKAKGGFLTEQEDDEFERLLEVKRYHALRQVQPALNHEQALARVRA